MKKSVICTWITMLAFFCIGCPQVAPLPGYRIPEPCEKYINEAVLFLEALQKTQTSGLVPILEDSAYTTTYSNAVSAIAFIRAGKPELAEKIFNVFASQTDKAPCPDLDGGFQQHRDAATGKAISDTTVNDFWIGDNSWLLAALDYYKYTQKKNTYYKLAQQLADWMGRLKSVTSGEGICGGFHKDGTFIEKHPEGSIDAYGALRNHNADDIRQSIKKWLDANVWVINGGVVSKGALTQQNLPLDNVSWGYLALGHEYPQYKTTIEYAMESNARLYDPYLLESFDQDPGPYWEQGSPSYWKLDRSDPDKVQATLERENNKVGCDLKIAYVLASDQWLRFYRTQDVNLSVTDEFIYTITLQGDNSNYRFEVKLQDISGVTYYTDFPLDFSGWRTVELGYHQFRDFYHPGAVPLMQIKQIEFAIANPSGVDCAGNVIRMGEVRYYDRTALYTNRIHGFSAFESEDNRIFIEGTCQMLSAFAAADEHGRQKYFTDTLQTLFLPTGRIGMGLPNSLHSGISNPSPESVATSWFIIGASGLNPFWPEEDNTQK